jgi:hypothetical protein
MTLPAEKLITTILWVAPFIQTLATVGVLILASSFRKGLGAQTSNTGFLAGFGAVMLVLHMGYFLAPHWWTTGRHLLGVATMLPVALLVLAALVTVSTQTDIVAALARGAVPMRIAAFAGTGALVLAYVGPIVLLLAASA